MFETELGTINATMTEAEHVHLEGDLTVNGVLYHVSFHLFLIDGVWQARNFRELYLSRRDFKEPSEAAKRKVCAVLPPAWTKHLAANAGMAATAQRVHLERRLSGAEHDAATLATKLQEAQEEVENIRRQLDLLES